MASHSTPRIQAFRAGADLSAKKNCFVKFGSDDESVVAAGAGEETVGILQSSDSTSGRIGEVALQGGGAKLLLGGTVTRGAYLKSDANGAGVAVTTDKDKYGAKAMASGVAGDVIGVEVVQGQASI